MKKLHQNKPAIFISTLGSEPQVVTASLDLLLRNSEPIHAAWVLHTTAPGTAIAEAVDRLKSALDDAVRYPGISHRFYALQNENGETLSDVETPQAAQSAFRALYNLVREAKSSGDSLHLSIAGGRKLVAIFGMLAAQLLFEDQDHLWYLHSTGEFLTSKRMHPQAGDLVRLVEIPVVQWSNVSPMLLDLAQIDDPMLALERQKALRLTERLEAMRAFALGSLTPGEERVVALLVREGLSDLELAERISISPRTVEGHLRSAYQKAAAHWDLPDVDRERLITLLNLYYTLKGDTGNPA